MQQNGPLYIMWKIFAIICIPIVNPMGITESQCQLYYEIDQRFFTTKSKCLDKAGTKAEEMLNGFAQMNIPFDAMQFGCEEEKTQ